MGKYDVKFSCGHEERIELFGKEIDRRRKIEYFEENGLCPNCYKEVINDETAKDCEVVEMLYKDYKNEYSTCKTAKNSYNKDTKTITVFIPNDYKDVNAYCEEFEISPLSVERRNTEEQARRVLSADIQMMEREYEKAKEAGKLSKENLEQFLGMINAHKKVKGIK